MGKANDNLSKKPTKKKQIWAFLSFRGSFFPQTSLYCKEKDRRMSFQEVPQKDCAAKKEKLSGAQPYPLRQTYKETNEKL